MACGNLGTLSITSAADTGQKIVDVTSSMAATPTNNNHTTDIFHFDAAPIAAFAVTYTAG